MNFSNTSANNITSVFKKRQNQNHYSLIQFPLRKLKNLHLSGSLFSENFSKLSIYSHGYTPFCFTSFKNLPLNSSDKYLKLLSDRFYKQ